MDEQVAETSNEMLADLGLANHPRWEKYLWVAQMFGCNTVVRRLAAASVDGANLNRQVAARVMAAPQLAEQNTLYSKV